MGAKRLMSHVIPLPADPHWIHRLLPPRCLAQYILDFLDIQSYKIQRTLTNLVLAVLTSRALVEVDNVSVQLLELPVEAGAVIICRRALALGSLLMHGWCLLLLHALLAPLVSGNS